MQNKEKWFLYLTNLLTTVSGWAYAWMIFFVKPVNEWDIINHPWQKKLQVIHLLVSPLLIFALGWIWKQHVLMKIRTKNKEGFLSGWLLILSFFPMVISGYSIQVSMETWWRQLYQNIHLVSSALWTMGFIVHLPLAFKKR
ncbi:MAG: hypothetical protein ACOYL6_16605 [Bacteriovoracaceae bacterium]